MISALVLGALAAAGSVQDDEVVVDLSSLNIEIPAIDIRIPAIAIEALDIYIPGFDIDIDIPDYDFDIPDIDIDLSDIDMDHAGHGYWSGHRHRYPTDREYDWTSVWDFDTDTTFAVNPNGRLEVRNHAGEVLVSTWDRNEVRIRARHGSRDRVKVFESGNVVRIKSESRRGPPDIVDYQLTMPASMGLDVWGVYTDVSVDGVQGGVRVETLEGDVSVRSSGGEMDLRSVEGEIEIRDSSGRIDANSVDGMITVEDVVGTLYLESIDGDIRLQGIDSDDVEAKTVDGDLYYEGSIKDNGRYRLTTHDGDVVVAVPAGANATVSVATFDGEFETSFPVQITRAEAGHRFSFTIGDGSARLELHAFDGDIQLVRQ